jgi:TolB-like protein/tRNA A-37 threonylcarbamoyl transferase component Bud32
MFAHYRIVEKIGEGGMGVVWKALDTKLNRHVALKLLPPQLTEDPERKLRFQREAQASAALDHPNIAMIYEISDHEGVSFIAMQYLEGETLRAKCQGRPMPMEDWLGLSIPLAEGLAHAHAAGVVHRDLKPDNIMITRDGKPKIMDFGLAKLLQVSKSSDPAARDLHTKMETISRELTQAGKVFGTVAYMSPEQARGKPVDHRSDIFSMGVMLYQMACGRLPFTGDSDVESLSATLTQEASPLSEFVTEVPAEAERVVRKALEKEPKSRYQHADDLAADLRNLKRDMDSGQISIAAGVLPATSSGAQAIAPPARKIPGWVVPGAVIVALILAAMGYFGLADRDAPEEEGVVVAPTGTSVSSADAGNDQRRIVVLPFENQGASEDEFFAAGITEELINKLALARGLGVISRSSAFQYERTGKSMKQIGEDFGVEYVLEGTVRWAKPSEGVSQVRISPQLVRVSDDTSLWAGTYDRAMDNIFEIQSEIAGKVIDQLGVVLLDSERSAVEARPTKNMAAYQAYLKGMQQVAALDSGEDTQRQAIQVLQRAVDADPEFALAYAGLARAHAALVHWGYERTEGRRELARAAAAQALKLAPDAPEARLAMGYYHYWCNKDYARALEEFSVALKAFPRSTDVLVAIAYVERRQGAWVQAVAHLEQARVLSPTDSQLVLDLGETYLQMRRYDDALDALDEAIGLAPDRVLGYLDKATVYQLSQGNLESSRAVLESMPEVNDENSLWGWYWQELYEGNYQSALARLSASSVEAQSKPGVYRPKILMEGLLLDLMGRQPEAEKSFEKARAILEQGIRETPDDFRLYGALGVALAKLGLPKEAVRMGSKSIEMYPLSRDFNAGTEPLANLAFIYTLVGRYDDALDIQEQLLGIPSHTSTRKIRLAPWSKPLVNHPRFAGMESRYR